MQRLQFENDTKDWRSEYFDEEIHSQEPTTLTVSV